MDFTAAKKIGQDIDSVKGGYDHNWILNKTGNGLEEAATVYDPVAGGLWKCSPLSRVCNFIPVISWMAD